jgi:hypothetical protein
VARSEESLASYRALRSVHGTASMLGTLDRALLERGEYERATGVLDEGLVLSQEIDNRWHATAALEGLAESAAGQGRHERATRLFGAVEALVEASGFAVHPFHGEGRHLRATRERFLSAVRKRLGEAAFAAAWDAGRAKPFEQAVAEALTPTDFAGGPGTPPAPPDPAAAIGLTPR